MRFRSNFNELLRLIPLNMLDSAFSVYHAIKYARFRRWFPVIFREKRLARLLPSGNQSLLHGSQIDGSWHNLSKYAFHRWYSASGLAEPIFEAALRRLRGYYR